MSDVVKPPIHGRDHRPGGSDPIPGIGKTEWARLERDSTTDINVPSATNTLIVGTTETITNATYFQVNSHQEIQVLAAGLYSVFGNTVWGTYGTSPRSVWVIRNSATTGDLVANGESANDLTDYIVVHGLVRLSVNDKLRLYVNQHSGGAYTIYGGGASGYDANFLEVRYQGAVGS